MRIKKGFVIREMCGEYIVTGEGLENMDFNKLLSLNPSATYLWREVQDKEFDAALLANLLQNKYEVTLTQALADAENLCQRWKEIGVVE